MNVTAAQKRELRNRLEMEERNTFRPGNPNDSVNAALERRGLVVQEERTWFSRVRGCDVTHVCMVLTDEGRKVAQQ